MEPYLSVIIPAYNEEKRIGESLRKVRNFAVSCPFPVEVIVVNDGSTDETVPLVSRELAAFKKASIELHLAQNVNNSGKGASIRKGILEARGKYVLFSDADLSTPIAEASKLLHSLESAECDVAVGSRRMEESEITVRQSRFRELGGRVFNLIVRRLTGLELKDTQCGFKAFRREDARAIFSAMTVRRFGFDVEALYLARKLGLKIAEIAVVWNHSEGSKVRYFRDALRMIAEILKIRVNDLFHRYRLERPAVLANNAAAQK